MNLEGQNLESLRRMVRHLQEENQELKELLKKSHITFNESKEDMTTQSINEGVCLISCYQPIPGLCLEHIENCLIYKCQRLVLNEF